MKKPKSRSNNPEGRPSKGLSETKYLLGMPAELRAAVDAAADREGLNIGQWIRTAIRARLGVQAPTDPGEV